MRKERETYPKLIISLNIPDANLTSLNNLTDVDITPLYKHIQTNYDTSNNTTLKQHRTQNTKKFRNLFKDIIKTSLVKHVSDSKKRQQFELAIENNQYNISYFNNIAGSYILLTIRNVYKYFIHDCLHHDMQPKLVINFRSVSSAVLPSLHSIAFIDSVDVSRRGQYELQQALPKSTEQQLSHLTPDEQKEQALMKYKQLKNQLQIDQNEYENKQAPQKEISYTEQKGQAFIKQPQSKKLENEMNEETPLKDNRHKNDTKKIAKKESQQKKCKKFPMKEEKQESHLVFNEKVQQKGSWEEMQAAQEKIPNQKYSLNEEKQDGSDSDNSSEMKFLYRTKKVKNVIRDTHTLEEQEYVYKKIPDHAGKQKNVFEDDSSYSSHSSYGNVTATKEKFIKSLSTDAREIKADTSSPKEQEIKSSDEQLESITSKKIDKPGKDIKENTKMEGNTKDNKQEDDISLNSISSNSSYGLPNKAKSTPNEFEKKYIKKTNNGLPSNDSKSFLLEKEDNSIFYNTIYTQKSSLTQPSDELLESANQSEETIDTKQKIEISKEDDKEDYDSADEESYTSSVCYKASSICSTTPSTNNYHSADDDFTRSTVILYDSFKETNDQGMSCDTLFYNAMNASVLHAISLFKNKDVIVGCQSNHSYSIDISNMYSNRGITTKFIHETTKDEELDAGTLIIDEYTTNDIIGSTIVNTLKNGGYLLLFLMGDIDITNYYNISSKQWDIKNIQVLYSEYHITLYCLQKRTCFCNLDSFLWKYEGQKEDDMLDYEYDILKQVTSSKEQEVYSTVQTFGFCVIKQFLKDCDGIHNASLMDYEEGLDLLNEDIMNDDKVYEYDDIVFNTKDKLIELNDGRNIRQYEDIWRNIQNNECMKSLQPIISSYNKSKNIQPKTRIVLALPNNDPQQSHQKTMNIKIATSSNPAIAIIAKSHVVKHNKLKYNFNCIRPLLDKGDAIMYDSRIIMYNNDTNKDVSNDTINSMIVVEYGDKQYKMNKELLPKKEYMHYPITNALYQFLTSQWKDTLNKRYIGYNTNNNLMNDILKSITKLDITVENILKSHYDGLIVYDNKNQKEMVQYIAKVQSYIVPGGYLFLITNQDSSIIDTLSSCTWASSEILHKTSSYTIHYTTRRYCSVDTHSCLRWKHKKEFNQSPHLSYECNILQDITITSPAYYHRNLPNKLSSHDTLKAINALNKYGFCIIRNILSSEQQDMLQEYNMASREDLSMHGSFLKEVGSYYDHHVDLNGPNIKKVSQSSSWVSKESTIVNIIYNIMHPVRKLKRQQKRRLVDFELDDLIDYKNLKDDDHDVKVDDVRLIVTFPDCPGDDFHTLTNHLYDNYPYLPPHYIRLLLPTSSSNAPLGAAFCAKSHHVLNKQKNIKQIFYNIVRPSNLVKGDVVLFDCRIVFVDLCNMNEDGSIWNPLVYVDWKRNWFLNESES